MIAPRLFSTGVVIHRFRVLTYFYMLRALTLGCLAIAKNTLSNTIAKEVL